MAEIDLEEIKEEGDLTIGEEGGQDLDHDHYPMIESIAGIGNGKDVKCTEITMEIEGDGAVVIMKVEAIAVKR